MNASLDSPGSSSRRFGPLVLAFLLAAFVAFVAHSSKQLPDRVATHFDAHGKPNGWMTRAQHLEFSIGVGVGTPVFVLGVLLLVKKTKGWGLNIPNRAYWLEPERQHATFEFLERQMFWLAGLLIVFHAVLFESVVRANAQNPAHLHSLQFGCLIGSFLAFLAVWIVVLVVHFRRPAA